MKLTRRETLKGVAVLAVTEKLTDGGYAPVSLPGSPREHPRPLPPGAGSREKFLMKCVGCGLCIAKCRGGCLAPSVSLLTLGRPEMDFTRGYCLVGCTACGDACPTGAIPQLQVERRPYVHMGEAVWKKDLCLRVTEGENCTACVRKCPVHAIHLVAGVPVVDAATCVGCGACQHVCPARPMPAISVKGYEMQRETEPMGERDLLAEMHSRIAAGAAVVVARSGVIVAEEHGRGIGPLLKLLDAGALRDAVVVDKVIGRAAAAICIEGGAKKVFAKLAGTGAGELFAAHGVKFEADKTVPVILNREQKGPCPMESAVKSLRNPAEMLSAIRETSARLSAAKRN